MDIVSKNSLSKDDFKLYVKDKYFGTIPPTKLVIHHTWKPTLKDWKGQPTFLGIKRYYESKGWSKGPHIFVAPDGIWLMTDMQKNGYHAGLKGNWRTIGIEVVGNYDHKKWDGVVKDNALFVINTLQKRLDISDDKIMFHRDYSPKSCPGNSISKEWLMRELERYRNKLYDDIPDWKNVVWGMSAKEVWLDARKTGALSKSSKFTDPLTKGEFMIIAKRLNIF
jgi:N-acetylmuramoyl-L-alanine amidase CwlA